MSQMFTLPSLELLLIAGRAVALVLGLLMFAWAFRHWRRAAMRDTQRVFEQLDLVRSELLIMKEVMHHTTRKEVPRNYTQESPTSRSVASERASALDVRMPAAPANGSARGYEIAARMARNGAGKEELIRNCGITSHEAELLVKLHGHKQRDQQGANTMANTMASTMEMIGRQPRTVEAQTASSAAGLARQQTSAQLLQNQTRQAANAPRQNSAATAAQRTPSAPVKNQGMAPRSRLVAVG